MSLVPKWLYAPWLAEIEGSPGDVLTIGEDGAVEATTPSEPGGAQPAVTDGSTTVAAAATIQVPAGTLSEPSPGTAAIDHLVQTAKVTLTAGDITALNGTSVEIVTAPGANKVLVPVTAFGVFHAGAIAYVAPNPIKMALGNAAPPDFGSDDWLQATQMQDVLTQASGNWFFAFGNNASTAFTPTSGSAWDDLANFENLPLVTYFENGGIDNTPPVGDGTCDLWVAYITADLT